MFIITQVFWNGLSSGTVDWNGDFLDKKNTLFGPFIHFIPTWPVALVVDPHPRPPEVVSFWLALTLPTWWKITKRGRFSSVSTGKSLFGRCVFFLGFSWENHGKQIGKLEERLGGCVSFLFGSDPSNCHRIASCPWHLAKAHGGLDWFLKKKGVANISKKWWMYCWWLKSG